jgi:nucleotide-binding universal stress UspA family protein
MFKHILIPTDGSAASARAAAAGVELARATGAKVTGFFAAPPATPVIFSEMMPVGYLPPERHAELIDKATTRYLCVIEHAAKTAGVDFEGERVTSDYPAEAIIEAAHKHKCDLIFMASHSRPGLSALILGSQTQRVLQHAKVPVLVFR